MKPKEFWIIGSEAYTIEQLEEPLAFHSSQIHVIEKSVYDQLMEELAWYKEKFESAANSANILRRKLNEK